ncbi:hypothetical protein LRS58_19020 [Rhodococcus sp. BH2-1]|nr:hypothetical protein [Rhodococcus sp. BH2-1]
MKLPYFLHVDDPVFAEPVPLGERRRPSSRGQLQHTDRARLRDSFLTDDEYDSLLNVLADD